METNLKRNMSKILPAYLSYEIIKNGKKPEAANKKDALENCYSIILKSDSQLLYTLDRIYENHK